MQVDSHLDRFMVDLRKRIKQRGEASSSSEIDQISESIHLALKTGGSATLDTASSKAAAAAPDTAAAPDVAVHSVAVGAPLAVPQPLGEPQGGGGHGALQAHWRPRCGS